MRQQYSNSHRTFLTCYFAFGFYVPKVNEFPSKNIDQYLRAEQYILEEAQYAPGKIASYLSSF